MHVPAALLAVPLLAGVAGAIRFIDSVDGQAGLLGAIAALAVLIAAAGLFLLDDVPAAVVAVVLGCGLCGASLGVVAAKRAYGPPLLEWFRSARPDAPVVLDGVLREDAARTPYGLSLVLEVIAIDGHAVHRGVPGGVRLSVGGELLGERPLEWRAGRTVRVSATLREPAVRWNPGVPNERRSLARRGVVLVGSVKSAVLVEVISRGTPLNEAAASIRAWTRERISACISPLDSRSAGVTTAVLIGDRTGLVREDERRMQEAGTFHVIAISGGNIAILAGVLLVAARVLLVPARSASLATGVALLAYGAVVVEAPSVSRAITVAVLVLTARVLDHRGAALNALSIAAVLAVAASPLSVADAGFILSFGATLGILLGVPLILGPPAAHGTAAGGWRHGLRAARGLFAATACAEIALAPAGATLFARIPLAGLLLNFAAIPLMTCVQIGGLAVLMTASWWEWGAHAAGRAAHLSATGLLESARLVDIAPWLAIEVATPVWWVVAAYYACALAGMLGWWRRAALTGLAIAAAFILAAPHALLAGRVPPPAMTVRVAVLDVGQADATLVQLPGGHALLVDAGGVPWASSAAGEAAASADETGERVIVPALRALGSRDLHALVLTHGDPDHIQGAPGVLRRVRARSVWEGVPVPPHAGLHGLASLAAARRMSWRTVQAGDAERFGGVEVRVLHPPPPDWERQRVRNDDSIVLEVRVGVVSILLPGDIAQEGERAVLPRLEPGRLVVLKAPHHGSASSSTPALLDVLRPAAVIFSCGRNNPFGHPHRSVVARYRALGVEIFSTAEDGAVIVETDGTKVEVKGWTGRRVTFGG